MPESRSKGIKEQCHDVVGLGMISYRGDRCLSPWGKPITTGEKPSTAGGFSNPDPLLCLDSSQIDEIPFKLFGDFSVWIWLVHFAPFQTAHTEFVRIVQVTVSYSIHRELLIDAKNSVLLS